MALPTPPPYTNPIPNNPFYSPFTPYVCGPYFPVATSAGIDITTGAVIPQLVNDVQNVLTAGPGIALTTFLGVTTITATGGGGGGGVSSITAGTGLTGGTITTTGTIALDNTTVTAGSYTSADITVDAQGRITAAANGSGGSVPSATPTVEGIVFGCTDSANFNYGLGDTIFSALTTGTLNVAIGAGALDSTDTGTTNVAIGIGSGYSNTSGNQNIAIGAQSLFFNATGGLNVAVGSLSLQNATGDANTALGNYAGNLVTTGCNNILIGNQAGGAGPGALDTGCDNVVIGNCVSVATSSGSCQLAIGTTTFCWLSGTSTGAIKPGAGIIDCASSCGTAGQVLMSNGLNAVCWGTASGGSGIPCSCITAKGALITGTAANTPTTLAVGSNGCVLVADSTALNGIRWGAPPAARPCSLGVTYAYNNVADQSVGVGYAAMDGCAGLRNAAVGHDAMINTLIGDNDNTALGFQALRLMNGASFNTAIGSCSMGAITTLPGNCNTAVGYNSLASVCSTLNTAVGVNALQCVVLGAGNIGVGANAGCVITSGTNNTVIGYNAVSAIGGLNTGSNNTVIGFNAATAAATSSNTITLGNSSITTIRAQVTTITSLSDARDKTDVTALPVGLDFVNSLTPVKFTWQMREPNEVKDGTSEAGFIAQELKAAQEASGASYLGLVYDDNPEKLEASPGKLIPVLVKAIQELSAKVEALEAKLEANG